MGTLSLTVLLGLIVIRRSYVDTSLRTDVNTLRDVILLMGKMSFARQSLLRELRDLDLGQSPFLRVIPCPVLVRRLPLSPLFSGEPTLLEMSSCRLIFPLVSALFLPLLVRERISSLLFVT